MSTNESDIVSRIAALNLPVPSEARNETSERTEAAAPNAGPDNSGRDVDPPVSAHGEASREAIERDGGSDGDGVEQGSSDGDLSEEIEIGDLNDLANHLGVDPADLYNISVPFTKNGEKAEFTLGDLKDKYQRFEETEALRADAQAQRDAYSEAVQASQQAAQNYAMQAGAIVQAMEQSLLQDFGQINWQTLQATNPAEYIRQQQSLAARQNQVAQMRHQAMESIEQHQKLFNEQNEHLKTQRLLREQQALLKAVPEWRDQKVADAERQDLARYMVERGYSEEEINNVDDHRAILLVRDAMAYRKLKASGDAAAKKVIKLAKTIKPGTRQTASEQSNDQERGLRNNLRQSGSIADAAAVIANRRLKIGR